MATLNDPDAHKGAVEGNPLDRNGLPSKAKPIAEDRIGANVDDSEVSNASETGRTSDAPRDEEMPID